MDNLSINNQRRTKPSRFLHDTRIALRPIISVHRVETHPTVAYMDLQPIAVMLQLVRPAWPGGWLLGDSRLTWMNEGGRRGQWPSARITPQHAADIKLAMQKRRICPRNAAWRVFVFMQLWLHKRSPVFAP